MSCAATTSGTLRSHWPCMSVSPNYLTISTLIGQSTMIYLGQIYHSLSRLKAGVYLSIGIRLNKLSQYFLAKSLGLKLTSLIDTAMKSAQWNDPSEKSVYLSTKQ